MENLSSNMEDYLKVIYLLQNKMGTVRVKDIAREMSITMPSVSSALKTLEKHGLVCHPRYDLVDLTSEGKKIAEHVFRRHRVIMDFLLKVLGLDHKIAEKDACGMEHNISEETLESLDKFLKERDIKK